MKNMMRCHIVISITLLFLLPACMVGDDYVRPKQPAVAAHEHYINSADTDEAGSMNHWWERLNDPLMAKYTDMLMQGNPSLQEAAARITQAQAQATISGSTLYPAISADIGSSRNMIPPVVQGGGILGGFAPPERIYATNYSAQANVSWQLDLFGRIRRAKEAAEALSLSAAYDREALMQSLIVQLLDTRVAISTTSRLVALAEDTVKNRRLLYDTVRRRYDLGVQNVTLSDVYLAEENITSVEADYFSQKRTLQEQYYQMDVLLGKAPGTPKTMHTTLPLMPPPEPIPACMPAHLLDRRPDIRASELRLKAANANIGVAIADLYPGLTLSGNIGFNSNTVETLIDTQQLAGAFISSLTTRLFEGGALRANIRLREAEAQEMAASYSNVILQALREVETAMHHDGLLRKEIDRLKLSAQNLEQTDTFSTKRYGIGIRDLRDRLETQRLHYAAQQQLLRTSQQLWNNRTALYLALGGDWFEDTNADIQPTCT